MTRIKTYTALILAFGLYSLSSIFTKGASGYLFLSWPYLWRLGCAVLILALYAIAWQQIIKRMPISDAYMFKGVTLLFTLVLSHLFFGEAITVKNILGAAVIVGGIALNAKS